MESNWPNKTVLNSYQSLNFFLLSTIPFLEFLGNQTEGMQNQTIKQRKKESRPELQREIGKEKSLGFLRRQGNPKIWGLEGIVISFFFPGMREG